MWGSVKTSADDTCDFLADSGASLNFTNNLNNFSEYNEIKDGPSVQTALKDNQLQVCSMGAVFLTYEIVEHGKQIEWMSHLNPVFYIPRLSIRLLSLGVLLTDGLTLRGTKSKMTFYKGSLMQMQLNPHNIGDTLFWLRAWVTPATNLLAKSTVFTVDYELLHHCFGHPSKDVLWKAVENTSDFPTVAQKTAQVFACFWKIALLWDDDVIQGPEIFTQKITTS